MPDYPRSPDLPTNDAQRNSSVDRLDPADFAFTSSSSTTDTRAFAVRFEEKLRKMFYLLRVGHPGGIAPLDVDGRVPVANLPASAGGTAATGGSSTQPAAYVPAGWGQFWHADLADTTTRATAAVVGDSVSLGALSSDPWRKGWAALLHASLQTKFGDGGSGWHGVALASVTGNSYNYTSGLLVDTTGTWTYYTAGGTADAYHLGSTANGPNDGPGFCLLCNTASPSAAAPFVAGTLTFNRVRGSVVKILHTSASNPFTVTVDGGAPQTITPSGAGNVVQSSSVTVTGAGPHTVVVTATAGSACFVYGIHASNSTGAALDNYARGSFASGSAVNTPLFGSGAQWSGGPSAVQPASLLVYAHGINDARLSVAEATYAANLRKWTKQVREAGQGAVDLLFLAPHVGTFDTASLYHRYCAIMRETAEAFGGAFVNLWPQYRNSYAYGATVNLWGTATPPLGTAGTDGVHPGDIGHADMAQRIVALIPQILGPTG